MLQLPVYVNPRLLPAEAYILDKQGLYVTGITEVMSPHYKAIAGRLALVINSGRIKRKSDAVGGVKRGRWK
jgi:hypothetical protein